MGNSKDFVKIQMYEHDYQRLNPEIRESMEIIAIGRSDLEYKKYPKWVEQKKLSNKEWFKLRDIEYDINQLKENKKDE